MNRPVRALLHLVLLLAISVSGDMAGAAGLHGEEFARGTVFPTDNNGQDSRLAGEASVLLKHESRLAGAALLAAARAELRGPQERDSLLFELADRRARRTPLSVRELVLRIPIGRALDLHLGRFFLGWGKTDGYSPADAFLPRDLTSPFTDEKLPVWGARLYGQRGNLRFDVVGVATTTPWRLPVLSSRYAPVSNPAVRLTEGANDPPATGFAAGRLLATTGDWDLGGWARFGIRPAPVLLIRTDLAAPDPSGPGYLLPADRRFVHEHGFGVEASRVTGAWVVHAELGALRSNAVELGDALLLSVGAERAFGDATLLVTFAANMLDTPGDPKLLFDRAFLPGLITAWNVSTGWGSWKLVYTHAFEHGDGLIKAELVYNLNDYFSIGGGLDWPRGSARGAFGALDDARRLSSTLRHRW